jgi:hypothetical protein
MGQGACRGGARSDVIGWCLTGEPEPRMEMTRQTSSYTDDHGWLITPRAIASLATVVGLVYTLHAPVRYVLHLGDTVEVLNARVATLETEIDQQRGTIAAAALVLESQTRAREAAPSTLSPARGEPVDATPRRTARRTSN